MSYFEKIIRAITSPLGFFSLIIIAIVASCFFVTRSDMGEGYKFASFVIIGLLFLIVIIMVFFLTWKHSAKLVGGEDIQMKIYLNDYGTISNPVFYEDLPKLSKKDLPELLTISTSENK